MKGDLPSYELRTPAGLPEALALLRDDPSLRPLAGGTDLMVLFASGKLAQRRLLNIWGLRELRGIEVSAEAITLGALTSYSELQANATVRAELPMLCQAASETGGWAIQNRGTLGGNIANASPAADSPPALLCYDAELELVSAAGSRWLRYADFHTGYKQTRMAPGELIARVRVPRLPDPGARLHFYRKVGPRRAQAISKVCFAGAVDVRGGRVAAARIALGGVAPVVLRCPEAEAALTGASPAALEAAEAAALAALQREIVPIDDVRSTARYRRRVAENLLRQLVGALRQHAAWHERPAT